MKIVDWTCQKCKKTFKAGEGQVVHHACHPKNNGKRPTNARRAFNFAKALANHVASGAEYRTREEIDEIREVHCKPCEFNLQNVCTKCGCQTNRSRKFFNKLAWKSEHCPVGKW